MIGKLLLFRYVYFRFVPGATICLDAPSIPMQSDTHTHTHIKVLVVGCRGFVMSARGTRGTNVGAVQILHSRPSPYAVWGDPDSSLGLENLECRQF